MATETPAKAPIGKKKRTAQDTAIFLDLARARTQQADEAEAKQLARERDDLRFLVDQWPDDIKAARAGEQASGGFPPIPARPCLTIDTLRDPIAHVAAEAQQTDLSPELTPADDFAELMGPIDDTEIELREGLLRRVQRESDARDGRNWAADRARKAGRGYYVVMTRYVSSLSADQGVFVDRLFDQSSVRLDPRHEKPDGSDADWEFYGTNMSWEEYKAEYPDRPSAKSARSDADEWRGLGDQAPTWFTTDGKTKSVRVMNYFYTERESVTLTQLESGRLVEDVPDGMTPALDEDGEPITAPHVKKSIKWAKIDGAQILDETDWESPYMPIVKVLWEEVQPYDNDRRVQGLVRPARDAAFGVSVTATTEVEVALLTPKTPIVGYAGQFEGFEAAWDQANVRNIGRLEVNATTDQAPPGAILPHPARLEAHAEVGVWDGLRQMFMQAVKSTTGVPDATLGNVDPSVRSARAIRQLIEQSRQGTSGGLGNLVKSVTYEAKIINSLLYPIYGRRPGRLLQMMTGKHESQTVLVGTKTQPRPFVRDAKQRPTPFDPQQHAGQEPQRFHLTEDAEFNVVIRVSKDFDSRRQEEASTMGELLQASPVLMTWFGDLFFDNQDGPGHKDMAKRAKVMLDPKIQAMLQSETQGQDASQAQAAQLHAALQDAQQKLQQAAQMIQTDQVKQQGQLHIATMKAEANEKLQLQLKQMDNASKIAVARISAAKSAMDLAAEAQEERLSTGLEQAHDAQQASHDRAHEVGMAALQHDHALQQGQQGQQAQSDQQGAQQQHDVAMADQGHQQALEQQAAQSQEPGYGPGV